MSVFYDAKQRCWIYDFWHDGVRRKRRAKNPDGLPATSRRQAQAAEDLARVEARNEARGQSIARPGDYTLAQAVTARSAEAQGLRSWRDAKIELAEIVRFFGPAAPIGDVAARWTGFRAHLRTLTVRVWIGGPVKGKDRADPRYWRDTGRRLSPARINRYLNQLSAVLRLAHATRTPEGMPLLAVPPAIALERLETDAANPVPLAVLAAIERDAATPAHLRDALALARLFGLRLREAMLARIDWIDAADRGLRIPAEIAKNRHGTFQPANEEAMALLARLAAEARARDGHPDDDRVHLIAYRPPGVDARDRPKPARPIVNARRAWAAALRRLGLEGGYRFHDVRARFITEVAKRASDRMTRELARHKDARTTDRYVDIAAVEKHAAVAGLPAIADVAPALARPPRTGTQSPTPPSHRATLRRVK